MEGRGSADEESPLVQSDQTPKFTPRNRARDIHILSVAFLLVFLAYGAVQNLESTINTEGNLGTTSLGILYVSFAVFSLISSLVVRTMGPKNALVLGTTGYWLFTAANLMPNWYTMVPASVYLGFAASIIWVGQGTYSTSAALAHARDLDLHEGSVIGNFNGEFGGMYAAHQVVGNIVSLLFLKDEKSGNTSGTNVLFIVFLCIMSIGTVLMCFLHKIHGKEEEIRDVSSFSFLSSVASASKTIVKPMSNRRLLLVIPLFAYSGLQQSFVWAVFTKSVVKPTLGESGVALSMVIYGAFAAIASVVGGRLTSNLKSVSLIVACGCSAQAIIFLWLLLIYRVLIGYNLLIFRDGYGLSPSNPSQTLLLAGCTDSVDGVLGVLYPLIMAAALGFGEGVLTTQLNALLGMLFKDDTEGAFAQLKVWQSSSIAALFFLMPYLTLRATAAMVLAVLCVAAVAFSFLAVRVEGAFSTPRAR